MGVGCMETGCIKVEVRSKGYIGVGVHWGEVTCWGACGLGCLQVRAHVACLGGWRAQAAQGR